MRKKYDKIVFLAKAKLNKVDDLISKILFDSLWIYFSKYCVKNYDEI